MVTNFLACLIGDFMEKDKTLFLNLRFLSLTFVCLLLLGMAFWVPSAQSERRQTKSEEDKIKRREKIISSEIRLENRTQGLIIIGLEKDIEHNHVRLFLRNDYKKAITGYKLSIGGVFQYRELMTRGYESINSTFIQGSTRQEYLAFQPGIETSGIKVLALIFDDGTTDGDPQYVREIRHYRLGMKMRREQSLNLLKEMQDLPFDEAPAALASIIESQIPSISAQDGEELPLEMKFGFEDEKKRFLREIQYIQSMDEDTHDGKPLDKSLRAKEKVTNLIDRYANSISKLVSTYQ
jgi:hypothetical protein